MLLDNPLVIVTIVYNMLADDYEHAILEIDSTNIVHRKAILNIM